MSRKFDLSVLFEPRVHARNRHRYDDLATELDGVRSRRKAMSMFPMNRSGVERDDAFFIRLLRAAFVRGLAVILDPDDPADLPAAGRGVHAFVLPLDQVWRVPAYRALWTTAFEDGAWSGAAEAQASLLLGYTRRERAAWLAQQRWRTAAWGARTVYTLLARPHKQQVVELGQRCFGPPSRISGMEFFVHGGGHDLKRHAAKLAPAGLTIARVAVEVETARVMFGSRPPGRASADAVVARVSKRLAPRLAAALRSKVEFLGARGWS